MAKKIYRRGKTGFVNPYHFVPLGAKCVKNLDYSILKKRNDLLAGWIDCKLETRAPLFIPNTTSDTVFGDGPYGKSLDFNSKEALTGKVNPPAPFIPGSEIRGMIRSAFEAVTNACMSTTDDKHFLYKRTNTPGTPGIIKKIGGSWVLQPCQQRIGISAWGKYGKYKKQDLSDHSTFIDSKEEGATISFQKSASPYKTKQKFPAFYYVSNLNGNQKGRLHKGEPIDNKHHESIFVESDADPLPLEESTLLNLLQNLKLYRDERINQHKKQGKHGGYAHLKAESIDDLDGMLVYCSAHNKRYYLSPAAIGREVFHNRLKDVIGSYTPCSTQQALCPACALFGFAGKTDAVSGRLRFSDAALSKNCPPRFLAPMVPPELASPKPSATEFYLERPSGNTGLPVDVWNYDYAGNWQGPNKLKDEDSCKPAILGRKFYWHGDGRIRNLETNHLLGEEISDRHIKIRPMDKGNSFSFRVNFNAVTPTELKRLIWVLEIGGSAEHGHKLGMGKPVGLGSVTISVENVMLRKMALSSSSLEYRLEPEEAILQQVRNIGTDRCVVADLLGGSEQILAAFLQLTQLRHGFSALIDYPRPEMGSGIPPNEHPSATFHWFVGNKQINGKGTGTKPVIDQDLPPVTKPEMQKIKVEIVQSGGRQGGGASDGNRSRVGHDGGGRARRT
jgi:CRISPR-associated protein (TIGR03986 family)